MEKRKETAQADYIAMIKKSWTWARLTNRERDAFLRATEDSPRAIIGTYRQRWDTLQAMYTAFLYGLNYSPIGWRESEPETPKF